MPDATPKRGITASFLEGGNEGLQGDVLAGLHQAGLSIHGWCCVTQNRTRGGNFPKFPKYFGGGYADLGPDSLWAMDWGMIPMQGPLGFDSEGR